MSSRKHQALHQPRRALELPVRVELPSARRKVLRLAQLLATGETEAAAELLEQLHAQLRESEEPTTRKALLRAVLLARIFSDLAQASWELEVDGGQVFAVSPAYESDRSGDPDVRKECKAKVRQAMEGRVREQLREATSWRLVRELEADGKLLHMLADGSKLAQSLRERGADAIQPYLQLARRQDGEDEATGLPLYPIFRYLRFFWSFPYGDVPGRTLPFLIRDRGQPGHPVCGLLCLSSPLLRLTARDDELGLTNAWLETIVAALDLGRLEKDPLLLRKQLQRHFTMLLEQLQKQREALAVGPQPVRLLTDLCLLLKVGAVTDAGSLGRALAGLGAEKLQARIATARHQVINELGEGLVQAIEGISPAGWASSTEELLANAESLLPGLEGHATLAGERWKESRRKEEKEKEETEEDSEGGDSGEEDSDEEVGFSRSTQDSALYDKKRSRQLSSLLRGWVALKPLLAARDDEKALHKALREHTSKRRQPWVEEPRLAAGTQISRGLSEALLQRKVAVAATRIAEVSLCGAVPPYNDLLVGKLAALLALSREAAHHYFAAYDGQTSTIQSSLAGRDIRRSSRLLALTTTSFYGVGTAQYNRLSLPTGRGELSWREVGASRGHGTLHFATETTLLASKLLEEEDGQKLITSRFGEGPSERLRKLRAAFSKLDLPEEELLKHGMGRLVFVASLYPNTRPGLGEAPEAQAHHLTGPAVDEVAAFWRSRWLQSRLTADRLMALEKLRPEALLLSARFPLELEVARAAAEAD